MIEVAREGEACPPPSELLVSQLPLIESVIRFVARRSALDAAETEELGGVVKLKLIENDYEVLRQFQGRSSLKTYLTVVVQRLFLDERTRRWGKWRASAEARRLGPGAVALESLVSRSGLTFDEAVETLGARSDQTWSRPDLERLRERLPRRTVRRFVGEEVLANAASDGSDVEERLLEREGRPVVDRTRTALRRALAALTAEDRLILKMRFDDSFTVAQIAGALRLEQRPLYRRIEQLLKSLRATLERDGVEKDQIVTLLEQGRFDLALDSSPPPAAAERSARPSKST